MAGVSKKAVLDEEFATFVDLELALHIGAEELLPHFHRILLSLDTTQAAYLGQDSASMLEADSLAQFCEVEELEARGASKEDLDRMREVLLNQVDNRMPWLSDVLSDMFEQLVSKPSERGERGERGERDKPSKERNDASHTADRQAHNSHDYDL